MWPFLLAAATLCGADTAIQVRRLTQSNIEQTRPVWSPDGQYVACVESDWWGETVVVVRSDSGLAQVGGASGGARVIGRPVWSADSSRVVWLTDDGMLNVLGMEGGLAITPAERPRRPRGVVPWPCHDAVIVFSATEAAAYPVGQTVPPSLELGSLNADIRDIAATPDGRWLLVVDGGTVFVSDGGAFSSPLLVPSQEIAEYTLAVPADDLSGVLTVARLRTHQRPRRLAWTDLATGEDTVLDTGQRAIAAAELLPDGRVLAVAHGRLLLFSVRDGVPADLTGGAYTDRAADVSQDARWLVVSSSGRDDTDGDGRASPDDPANLYVMELPAP